MTMSQARRSPLAIALTIALAMPGSARAVEPVIPSAPVEDPIAAAQALHNQALARFDVADYGGAIERWEAANDRLPDDPSTASIRRIIINNLAVALSKQYAIERDVRLLRRSRQLALDYERSIDALYPEPQAAADEHTRIAAFVAELDRQLAAAESSTTTTGPAPEPSEPAVADPPVDGAANEQDAQPASPSPRRRGLVAGGAVALGVGVAGLAMLGAGVGIGAAANDVSAVRDDKLARERQFDRGRRANDLAIAGAVVAPIALAVGIALVVVGVRGPTKRRSRTAWSPWGGDRAVGMLVRGAF